MTEQVKDVVDRFRRLDPDEQTQAYLEIEKIWKDPSDEVKTIDAPKDQTA